MEWRGNLNLPNEDNFATSDRVEFANWVFMQLLLRFFVLVVCGLASCPVLAQPLYDNHTMRFIHKQATEIKIPQPSLIKVGIDNPLKQSLLLGMVRGETEIELAKLGKEEIISVELPPGKYFVTDEKGGRFALPVNEGQDIEIVPIVKMKSDDHWAWIPAGPSIAGDQLGVGAMDERPVRVMSFSAFWLQKTEVTNQQFAKFLNAQSEVKPEWIDLKSHKCLIKKTEKSGVAKFEPDSNREQDAAEMPVVMVSYFGATAYCDWLTKVEGIKHRLPTERVV